MPLAPLYGHEALRRRLLDALAHDTLPASLLLHGQRGIGKQRVALWLAQALQCERPELAPCNSCHACRAVLALHHPDVYWFYPRPRLKDADARPADVLEDYGEGNAERVEAGGLYAPASGTEGLYVSTIRTIVQRAGLAPAMGRRKVFVVGDAERMVSQEGADQAANAFLKLLEEPLPDTIVILTSSEPGALLPTIRSRVASYRMAPLKDTDVRAFLEDPAVREVMAERWGRAPLDDRVALAAGAPGSLMAGERRTAALDDARLLLDAASRGGSTRYSAALSQGVASARGAFAETLEALNVVLGERVRAALARHDDDGASRASRGIHAVARAEQLADGNVSPQLVTARLLSELSECLS